jgi:DNA repair protein RecO (recombination protein O)
MDRAYVLHSYPYRETSLILQAWTERHGRIGIVAKGARRPKSASRSLLVPFQPLVLDWFGRAELKTLKGAEPAAPATPLAGQALLSAFYLNELLLKLTSREDPHEGLFKAYDEAIVALREISRSGIGSRTRAAVAAAGMTKDVAPAAATAAAGRGPGSIEPILRRFELSLLRELGYAVELTREAGTHAPIVAEREYLYVVERGPVAAPTVAGAGSAGDERADAIRLRGLTLLDLERGRFEDPETAVQAKGLMRLLINHSLNGQELATRAMVRETVSRPSPKAEGA